MTRALDKPCLPRRERYLGPLGGQTNDKSFAHQTWENALVKINRRATWRGRHQRAAPLVGVAVHEVKYGHRCWNCTTYKMIR